MVRDSEGTKAKVRLTTARDCGIFLEWGVRVGLEDEAGDDWCEVGLDVEGRIEPGRTVEATFRFPGRAERDRFVAHGTMAVSAHERIVGKATPLDGVEERADRWVARLAGILAEAREDGHDPGLLSARAEEEELAANARTRRASGPTEIAMAALLAALGPVGHQERVDGSLPQAAAMLFGSMGVKAFEAFRKDDGRGERSFHDALALALASGAVTMVPHRRGLAVHGGMLRKARGLVVPDDALAPLSPVEAGMIGGRLAAANLAAVRFAATTALRGRAAAARSMGWVGTTDRVTADELVELIERRGRE